jgi:biotin transport system permease protein
MSGLGLYVPGDSPLHRVPAGLKLALLAVAAVVALWSPVALAALGLLAVAGFVVARVPLRVAWDQLVPVLWFAVPLLAFQWLFAGWSRAVVVVGQLLVLVLLAALVTLTTRVLAMVATFEWVLSPLARVGVHADRVGLVLALTVRCVPLVAQTYQQAREAQRARGLEWSAVALVVPLIVRLLKKADAIGEALAARGLDD